MKHHEQKLIEAVNKYNTLVLEYQNQNVFSPILPQQEATETNEVPQQTQNPNIKKIVTKDQQPDVVEMQD